jgi:hypothetical protein
VARDPFTTKEDNNPSHQPRPRHLGPAREALQLRTRRPLLNTASSSRHPLLPTAYRIRATARSCAPSSLTTARPSRTTAPSKPHLGTDLPRSGAGRTTISERSRGRPRLLPGVIHIPVPAPTLMNHPLRARVVEAVPVVDAALRARRVATGSAQGTAMTRDCRRGRRRKPGVPVILPLWVRATVLLPRFQLRSPSIPPLLWPSRGARRLTRDSLHRRWVSFLLFRRHTKMSTARRYPAPIPALAPSPRETTQWNGSRHGILGGAMRIKATRRQERILLPRRTHPHPRGVPKSRERGLLLPPRRFGALTICGVVEV